MDIAEEARDLMWKVIVEKGDARLGDHNLLDNEPIDSTTGSSKNLCDFLGSERFTKFFRDYGSIVEVADLESSDRLKHKDGILSIKGVRGYFPNIVSPNGGLNPQGAYIRTGFDSLRHALDFAKSYLEGTGNASLIA